MAQKLECLRCGNEMDYIRSEKLQLGETGIPFSNFLSGALEVDIYYCKACGKLEFYHTKESLTEVKCPDCGETHHRDYPKCPYCKYDYRKR